MDFEEFGVVKYEKSKALRRYIMARKLGNLIRVAEALCVLFLIGYYFYDVSFVIGVGRGFLVQQLKALTTPLSAFLFGNCIVLVIFVLSSRGKVCGEMEDGDDDGNALFPHSCEGYESFEKSSLGESCTLRMETKDSPDVTGSEDLIGFSLSTEEVKEVMTVTAVYVDVDEIPTVVKETPAESASKHWEDEISSPTSCDGESKTDSPIVPSEGSSNNRVVLCGSNSGLGRWASGNGSIAKIPATVADNNRQGPRPRLQSSVDDLSDEEFNLKVERYIAEKKLMLWEEMLAERCAADPREIEAVVISDKL